MNPVLDEMQEPPAKRNPSFHTFCVNIQCCSSELGFNSALKAAVDASEHNLSKICMKAADLNCEPVLVVCL